MQEKKYEAATGEKAVDKMVRLIGKEDTFKDRDQEDKNKGVVYQFWYINKSCIIYTPSVTKYKHLAVAIFWNSSSYCMRTPYVFSAPS